MPQLQAHTPGSAAILGCTLCGLEARVPDERAQNGGITAEDILGLQKPGFEGKNVIALLSTNVARD
jgi:hypothetical protein